MRIKALKAILYFFLLMAALTLVSRAADNITLANVKVTRVGSGALTHETQTEGLVTSASATPVWAAEGLRVKEVAFQAGESAKKGDVLMYYDRDNLIATLDGQRLALKKIEADRSSTVELEMEADMLLKQRALDDAQAASDKARGSKAKKEAAKKLDRTQEDFDVAQKQWNEKLAGEEKRLASLDGEAAAARARILELEEILKNDCALDCPFDAAIISRKVEAGSVTGTEACWIIADKSASLSLEAEVTREQAKYIKPTDKAQTLPAGQRDWLDAAVESVSASAQGNYKVSVSLGDAPYSVGDTVQVKFSQKTDSYKQCVPLSALYGDSAGDYVLVVADTKSVLGDTLTLRRVSVTVQDRDQTRAAITASLTQDEKIVVKSDKTVGEGSRVRVDE